MIYKDYGKTGKKLSVVGNAGSRFDKSLPVEHHAEMLLYAFEQGVNHFDTCAYYNHSHCEDIYGLAIKQLKRDSFFASSKTCPQPPHNHDTKEKVKAEVRRSLERMNLDRFDFYYLWQVKTAADYELAMRPGGMYEGLLELKSEGLIGHICVSVHMPGDEVIQVIETGSFEGVLLSANILNFPYTLAAAKRAKELGMGVGAMSPLAGGLIPQHEDRLGIRIKEGETLTESAVRFITHAPWLDFGYFAVRTKEHIDGVCKAAEGDYTLGEAELADIREKIGEGLKGACTSCMYCVEGCPQKIPIASYMQLYNKVYVFGDTEDDFKGSLKFFRNWQYLASRRADAKDCVQCGQCEKACTQKLDIIERLRRIAEHESAL